VSSGEPGTMLVVCFDHRDEAQQGRVIEGPATVLVMAALPGTGQHRSERSHDQTLLDSTDLPARFRSRSGLLSTALAKVHVASSPCGCALASSRHRQQNVKR